MYTVGVKDWDVYFPRIIQPMYICCVYQLNILFKQEEEHFWPNHDNDGVVPEPPGGTGGEQDHTARGRKEKDGNTSSPNAASVNLLYNIILKRW